MNRWEKAVLVVSLVLMLPAVLFVWAAELVGVIDICKNAKGGRSV